MHNRIKELRENNNLTLSEMAEQTGIKRGTINNYENEKTEPKLKTWLKLARFFQVPVSYIQGLGKDVSEIKKETIDIIRNNYDKFPNALVKKSNEFSPIKKVHLNNDEEFYNFFVEQLDASIQKYEMLNNFDLKELLANKNNVEKNKIIEKYFNEVIVFRWCIKASQRLFIDEKNLHNQSLSLIDMLSRQISGVVSKKEREIINKNNVEIVNEYDIDLLNIKNTLFNDLMILNKQISEILINQSILLNNDLINKLNKINSEINDKLFKFNKFINSKKAVEHKNND